MPQSASRAPVFPVCCLSAQGAFRDFYLSKHTGRRLVWYNGLSTCVIKAQVGAGGGDSCLFLGV